MPAECQFVENNTHRPEIHSFRDRIVTGANSSSLLENSKSTPHRENIGLTKNCRNSGAMYSGVPHTPAVVFIFSVNPKSMI